jgi:hypothetical protein
MGASLDTSNPDTSECTMDIHIKASPINGQFKSADRLKAIGKHKQLGPKEEPPIGWLDVAMQVHHIGPNLQYEFRPSVDGTLKATEPLTSSGCRVAIPK